MDAFVSKSPIQKYKEIIEIRTDVSFLELYGMEYLIENFDEETKQKIMDSPYWNLKYIITIDRKWLQRKLEEWKFDYTMKYLYDFFRGVDKVDDYILINISKIIEVLEKEKGNQTIKGDLIKSAFLTSTMGVSYKLKLPKNI